VGRTALPHPAGNWLYQNRLYHLLSFSASFQCTAKAARHFEKRMKNNMKMHRFSNEFIMGF
jgi:hypothetical protein